VGGVAYYYGGARIVMGFRVITLFNRRNSVGIFYSRNFPMVLRHRLTATWLLLSWIVQPLTMTAGGVPVSHFAPQSTRQNYPFVWVPHRPTAPFLDTGSGKSIGWTEAWLKNASRKSSASITQPTSHEWQPTALNENSPFSPPDGMPTVQPSPVVGIINTSGNCFINGEVSDATSLNPLAGAFVNIAGTGRTAETDAKGRFTIGGLPADSFTLEATKLGYYTESSVVSTLEGQPAEVRLGLRLKPSDDSGEETTLEEETIVGEYQGDSQGDLFTNLELGSTVTSGISKEEFTKTGVSDAAGAVGKIAGANIVGGKFAVVRGLADRYVTTLFNGAAISSADPSRKAVQLDIFPTTAMQGIDISKTYTPDLPGDFGGGTIRIKSLSIPDKRFAEFKYKLTGNSNLEDRMLAHPDRDLGFWGDVDEPIPDSLMWNVDASGEPESFNAGGNRVTPGNTNNASQRQAQINAGKAQQEKADALLPKQRALHKSQDFIPKEVEPKAAESFSLVYGDKFKFSNGNELGFVGAFQHATQDEVNAYNEENRLTSPARSWVEESYAREVDWSLYLAGGLKLGENHQINATYFRKRIATDNIKHGTDYQIEGDGVFGAFAKNDATISRYGASAIYNKEFWVVDPVIRDTELMQLSGQHKNDVGTSLSWGLTRSTARESRPHSSTFQNGELDFTDPQIAAQAALDPSIVYNPTLGKVSTIQYQTFVNDGIGSLDSSRETQFIEETTTEGSLDLRQSIYLSEKKEDGPRIDLAVGASNIDKQREQQGRVYLMRTASWERWVARNPPAWWTSNSGTAPYSPGSPLNGTTLADGSPLPEGFRSLGEYLAANPQALADYMNGYGSENSGRVPGSGTGGGAANYVQPDAPYYTNGSGLEVRNVDSDLSLTALYASGTFHGEFWRFGGGARWEEEVKEYIVAADPLTRLLGSDPSRFGSLTTNAFIPALYGGIDVIPETSWLNLAWSRTVARPTFFEYLPIESIDQETGIIRRGNPNLVETSIENLDASLDVTFSESINSTISLFRKQLDAPIVVVQRVDQGQNSNTYVNGDTGVITGIELETRWKPQDQPFSLTGNYTFIDSALKYAVNQGIAVTELETRFPFQPSQILNLTLGWEPADSPWSAFLTTNFTDEYPTILRSEPSAYDVWLKPQLALDLIVARKFDFDSFTGTVTLGVKNIIGTERVYEYRGGTSGGDGGPLDGLVYTIEDPEVSYSIEFKAAF
jgi:hypothetical protein